MPRKRAHYSRSYEHSKYYIKFDDSLGGLFLLLQRLDEVTRG
jgi:hypothetical protein